MKNHRIWAVLSVLIVLVMLQSNAMAAVASETPSSKMHGCHQMADAKSASHCEKTTAMMDHNVSDNCCQADCHCPSICLSSIHSSLFLQAVLHFNPIKLSFTKPLPMAIINSAFYRPPIA